MKILLLCPYFNRPKLVRKTLQSVLAADEHHKDWELVFGDDGSKIPGKPIVEDILWKQLEQITIFESEMTLEQKLEHGLKLGDMANWAINRSEADIAIILCDDDELHPEYLKNLSDFFESRPDVLYAYSKIHLFNPLIQQSKDVNNLNHRYNQWSGPINPVGKVDASQVAWRIDCCKKLGAWFYPTTKLFSDKPWIKDTDRCFFENLYAKCGECFPTDFVAQYKGVHDYQLLWHKNTTVEGLRKYDQMYRELGGDKF